MGPFAPWSGKEAQGGGAIRPVLGGVNGPGGRFTRNLRK